MWMAAAWHFLRLALTPVQRFSEAVEVPFVVAGVAASSFVGRLISSVPPVVFPLAMLTLRRCWPASACSCGWSRGWRSSAARVRSSGRSARGGRRVRGHRRPGRVGPGGRLAGAPEEDVLVTVTAWAERSAADTRRYRLRARDGWDRPAVTEEGGRPERSRPGPEGERPPQPSASPSDRASPSGSSAAARAVSSVILAARTSSARAPSIGRIPRRSPAAMTE